ncbi:MAG: elongation factor P [Candidatus Marinimicrobia bacterium]|jgi:elongation factor P|nr:elongation factor P [Candidatus Neomarinimicrobiota bacterium]
MATTSDIRNGMVIEHKGRRMKIISFLHVKPGKGGAFVRTKLKNVVTGQVVDETFRGGAKIKEVRLQAKNMQYLYSDGDSFVFMDMDTFEQLSIPDDVVGNVKAFLKDGIMVKIQSIEGDVIGLEPPVFVELEVTDTEPGVRGNTATGATKPATLETGHTVTVPLFIEQGENLKVDTRTGKYVERVK